MEQYIRSLAISYGFSACGFTLLSDTSEPAGKLYAWLSAGFDAGMKYMGDNLEVRLNPSLLLNGAKSAIVVLMNYFPPHVETRQKYKIASYAWGSDYHYVVRHKLRLMADELSRYFDVDVSSFATFCDSAPLLDRYWAWKAGLGWIGKNGMLVNPSLGSFTFIGVMLTTLQLKQDSPMENRCGKCSACIDACPTKAISENHPGLLDANRCISYLTIESRDEIPDEYVALAGNSLYGCEKCIAVCPWNRFAKPHDIPELMPVDGLFDIDWCNADNALFRKKLKYSAMKRAGARKLRLRALQIDELLDKENTNQDSSLQH